MGVCGIKCAVCKYGWTAPGFIVCDYMLETGVRRSSICKAGQGCIVYERKEINKNARELDASRKLLL